MMLYGMNISKNGILKSKNYIYKFELNYPINFLWIERVLIQKEMG